MGRTACTEPQCLYSRAIPLLPLWAVRPVQSLSACTVELYLYSPYGPYGLYRASLPVEGCTLMRIMLYFWNVMLNAVVAQLKNRHLELIPHPTTPAHFLVEIYPATWHYCRM